MLPSLQRGAHPAATRAFRWGSGGTDCAWYGLIEEILKGKMGRDKVKNSDKVMESSQCIARETSELAYSWDYERVEKTRIVDDGNCVN